MSEFNRSCPIPRSFHDITAYGRTPLYHHPFNSIPSREGKLSTLSLRRGEGQGEGFPDNDKLDFT
jgi:hypothetical protein